MAFLELVAVVVHDYDPAIQFYVRVRSNAGIRCRVRQVAAH